MTTINLAPVDWAVILGYLAIVAGIGLAVSRRVRDTEAYFLGNHGFGKWLMMAQSFGVGTHAEQPVALAGSVYHSGFAAIWYQWKNMFATPFYWLMAPVFRRCRRTSIAEIVEDRYGPGMAVLYTLFALVFFILNTGTMLTGAGKVISAATGGGVSVHQMIFAMTVTFVLYSFVGGLLAAAWTDFLQSFLILTLSFMLLPLGWAQVGGFAGMKQTIGRPEFFSLATPGDVTPSLIAALTLNGLVGIMAQPHILASVGTGKDENACRAGFTYGTFIKRFCTVGWALVGLITLALPLGNAQRTLLHSDPELAFGMACRHLLFPGFLGLLIASVLAANMSACSAFMVDAGALFTRGFYDRFLAPGHPDHHYLAVGRLSGMACTLLGVVYALWFVKSVLFSFLLTETLATYFGVGLLGGLIWRRANRYGAAAAFTLALATHFGLHIFGGARLDKFDPLVFFWSLSAGVFALIVVSLVTSPEGEHADELFTRLATPVEAEAGSGIAERRPLLLVNLLGPHRAAGDAGVWKAYQEDWRGFAASWLVVALMVASVWCLLRIG